MVQAVIANTFEDAVNEAIAYRRMGGLDDQILRDIAWDYRVSYEKLKQAVEDL